MEVSAWSYTPKPIMFGSFGLLVLALVFVNARIVSGLFFYAMLEGILNESYFVSSGKGFSVLVDLSISMSAEGKSYYLVL